MAKGWTVSAGVRQGITEKALEIVAATGGAGEVVESTMRAIQWLETAPTAEKAGRMRKAELLEAYRYAIGAAEELYRAAIVLNATMLDGGIARSETASAGADAKIANDSDGKQAAKVRVLALWDALPEVEQVKRGAVLRFATATALRVPDSTVDGIKKWIARRRKEKRTC